MKTALALVTLITLLVVGSCRTAGPVRTDDTSRNDPAKDNPALLDTYWKVVELNGKSLNTPVQGKREAHLRLQATDNRVTGNGGCNSFSGTYTLTGNRIQFSPLAATKMACLNENREDELFDALRQVDTYTVTQDTLSLNKARMVALVKLVAVPKL